MQYKIVNGAVYYGSDMVLENIDIEINGNEKIAVVGRNGCGKTTLLKAIMGEVELEEGTGENGFRVIKAGSPNIAYLRQMPFENEKTPMLEEVKKVFSHLMRMEKEMNGLLREIEEQSSEKAIAAFSELNDSFIRLGGLTYQKETEAMVRHFGFSKEDEKKPVSEFSGGQRTKISFMKILLSKPDILLLDEPTNHLDIETIQWLEDYLKNYKSALVIVSHDRMFLERIVNKVYEIEWGETRGYKGNYSAFEKQKRENFIKQQKDHEAQQAEIERITRLIERFRYKATKAKMVQSKIKLLEHMKIINAPNSYDTKTYKSNFQPDVQSSRQVLSVQKLVIGYDSPLAEVSFQLERGQKLGIIGGNGIGKSTLLKTITGALKPISGIYNFGYNAKIAYFDQQLAQLSGNDAVIDVFQREYPMFNGTEARSALASFQFTGDDVFRSVSTLSGGEKVRLTLCKLLYKRPNVLILDEPTNHMDIIGKETLEEILTNYEGTVIFVSHDRYFVRKIADRLLVFENGKVNFFSCSYDEYEQMKKNAEAEKEAETLFLKEEPKKSKGKYISPQRELEKKKKRIEKLELLMENLNSEINELSEELLLPEICSDYKKITEIQSEIDSLLLKQSDCEKEWTALMEETGL